MVKVHVIGPHDTSKKGTDITIINTTSKSKTQSRFLSPFYLGPVTIPGNTGRRAVILENGWQFSKVYPEHWDGDSVTAEWLEWASAGWNDTWAHRYPMGKGAKPVGSYYNGKLIDYVEARKRIYVPMYKDAVTSHPLWQQFLDYVRGLDEVYLWDFDGYDTDETYQSVLDDPERSMGHAFIIRELILGNDPL